MGEAGVGRLTPLVVAAFAYQCIARGFRQLPDLVLAVAPLPRGAAVGIRVPDSLFGVLAGVLLLGEPLTLSFVLAALLVAAGLVLVNLRA
jgi:drug/metabolite transporter (DMT)-like permease